VITALAGQASIVSDLNGQLGYLLGISLPTPFLKLGDGNVKLIDHGVNAASVNRTLARQTSHNCSDGKPRSYFHLTPPFEASEDTLITSAAVGSSTLALRVRG
jgi:hypothetical protein